MRASPLILASLTSRPLSGASPGLGTEHRCHQFFDHPGSSRADSPERALLAPQGLECYDPSRESTTQTQPGTKGHAGRNAPEFLHDTTWQRTLRSQVTISSRALSPLCELHNKQPQGLLGPNAHREKKQATSRSCGFQAPFSATR